MTSSQLPLRVDHPRRSPPEIGRVLFIDGDLWEPFGQLAAALRCYGIASDHLTAEPRNWRGWISQQLERPLFDRTSHPVQRGPAEESPAQVDPRHVTAWITSETLDVQSHDDLGAQLLRDPGVAVSPLCHTRALREPADIYDKWAMTQLARMCGVPTPLTWSIHEKPPPSEPLVVKAPIGFGGRGVAVVPRRDQLHIAVAKMREANSREPFLQEFVGTHLVNVAGVADRGRILLSASYQPVPAAHDPLGPPASVELLAHDGATQSAARLVEATGFHGLFCIDFVRDDDDRALFIDFNPRVFGAMGALQQLGYDFIGAYLATLGFGAGPRWRRSFGATRAATLGAPPAAGPLGSWLTTRWATIRQQQAHAGVGWARTTRARTLALAAQASAQRFTGLASKQRFTGLASKQRFTGLASKQRFTEDT